MASQSCCTRSFLQVPHFQGAVSTATQCKWPENTKKLQLWRWSLKSIRIESCQDIAVLYLFSITKKSQLCEVNSRQLRQPLLHLRALRGVANYESPRTSAEHGHLNFNSSSIAFPAHPPLLVSLSAQVPEFLSSSGRATRLRFLPSQKVPQRIRPRRLASKTLWQAILQDGAELPH
eukprot:Skav208798  [mRNA]  locus=scaffold478:111649:126679:+ [translate_table: standard]